MLASVNHITKHARSQGSTAQASSYHYFQCFLNTTEMIFLPSKAYLLNKLALGNIVYTQYVKLSTKKDEELHISRDPLWAPVLNNFCNL